MPRSRAPGRVNVLGDHTDYSGGLALPAALPMATVATFTSQRETELAVTSQLRGHLLAVQLSREQRDAPPGVGDPALDLLAAIVWSLRRSPRQGGHLQLSTTVPEGVGLSSSAALCVALALALGHRGGVFELAERCRAAELAAGRAVGLLDQVASLAGVADHLIAIDFTARTATPVRFDPGLELAIVDSGERRSLTPSGAGDAGHAYAERRAACNAAAALLGPLHAADAADVATLTDPTLRRRARHVVTENQRVRDACGAASGGDWTGFGQLMDASHRSLAEDYEVSTPAVDALAAQLRAQPGVLGARLTGAGFGGCVVALCEAGAVRADQWRTPAWVIRPAAGAQVELEGEPIDDF